MYLSHDITVLFWIGIGFILLFVVLFAIVAKKAHTEIKLLRNLKD